MSKKINTHSYSLSIPLSKAFDFSHKAIENIISKEYLKLINDE